MSDCVAALLIDQSNRLCLQHRDDKKNIFFPGLWGLFGGSVESNESPEQALVREVKEELEIEVIESEKILTVTINSLIASLNGKKRHFFLIKLTDFQVKNIVLHEGQESYCFETKRNSSHILGQQIKTFKF